MTGQQRLLIVVLATLLVSIAIFAGFSLFRGNAVTCNREGVVSTLMTLGSKAQVYLRKPVSMAGGGGSFAHFQLASSDTGDADGSYSCSHEEPRNTKYVPGSATPIRRSKRKIYIVGCGRGIGTNRRDVVKAYVVVTRDSLETKILN